MDPNANYDELSALAAQFLESWDQEEEVDTDDAYRMAELFTALDAWIRSGGFLPRAWRKPREREE
ncbi:MAG: hypothetical protein R3322_00395 [Kiloniellales bacterium]|nr:hypothetical protein [Kiloniellales bacterium]